jgi:hypothetical protein
VYRAAFERLISEFKQYGPLLAEIKKAYDNTVAQSVADSNEIYFLKCKIQTLMSENENRNLLKAERRRVRELEEEARNLQIESQK